MERFQYSRTYEFTARNGRHYFFNLVERFGETASFRPVGRDREDLVDTAIETDGDVETATFLYYGYQYILRADCYHPKDYPLTIDGRLEKKDDSLKDAHLHTLRNREELERSQICYCISCQTFFTPGEIDCYVDDGQTAVCPYCDIDAVIGEGSGIKLTDALLEALHTRYF